MPRTPRMILAPNASPMTLNGTNTYLVGRRTAAIIDPGSADPLHLAALAAAVESADRVVVVVTHDHPDHSAGAAELAGRTGDRTVSGEQADGTRIETDDGELVVVHTPGHTPDHVALHWPAGSAVFCGDLMMGGLDTAVVAPPEGNLRAYLASLERVRELAPEIIYPAHGPAITRPLEAIDRYIRHRHDRLDQIRRARSAGVRGGEALFAAVYGAKVPEPLREVARAALDAYVDYLDSNGDAD